MSAWPKLPQTCAAVWSASYVILPSFSPFQRTSPCSAYSCSLTLYSFEAFILANPLAFNPIVEADSQRTWTAISLSLPPLNFAFPLPLLLLLLPSCPPLFLSPTNGALGLSVQWSSSLCLHFICSSSVSELLEEICLVFYHQQCALNLASYLSQMKTDPIPIMCKPL